MQDIPAIAALYGQIDAEFESERARAAASGNAASVSRVEAKQRINDQAYFLLCWGQIEVAVDDACRNAIRKRIASTDWAVRRAWDLYNPDDKRLSGLRFEDRLAIVLDRQAGAGSPFARAIAHYSLRNSIGHGRLRPERIDVQAVVSDFHQIQSSLTVR